MQRWPQQNHEGEAGKNNTKKKREIQIRELQ